jgi:hypothetical protein
LTDHEGIQLKRKEEQTREQNEDQNEDTESEKILEAIEEYSDQVIVEEEIIDRLPFNNQEEQIQEPYQQEERAVETTGKKTEVDNKEEVEEPKLVEKQSPLQEEYEDQVIIREADTEDHPLTFQEEIANNSLEEGLEQKPGILIEKEYEDQFIVGEIDTNDQLITPPAQESKEECKAIGTEVTKEVSVSEGNKSEPKEVQEIKKFVEDINTQIQAGHELDSKTYSYLNSLNTDESYPNIAFVYKRDGGKSVEILDRGLYDKLLGNQELGNFRLEWQRYWFGGIKKIKPTEQGRKIFLVDLSEEQELPESMRRIFLAKNTYTWNTLAPTKRELSSKNLGEFTESLFGKRAKSSDFEGVNDFTYQKKMKFVWNEFQRVFSNDINLKTPKRPALFALKSEYTRESVEHVLIGTFWKYHYNLDRIGRRNMKQWGYNNLLQYMEKKATGVYPTVVDPNYTSQNFIIRVINKGGGFAQFLDTIDEIKGTDPKYKINKIYRSWIVNNEILQSNSIDGLNWGVDRARATRYIDFKNIAHLMSEKNPHGINAVLEALFEDKNAINALNNYLGPKFSEKQICSSTGNTRANSGAVKISYPDLEIKTEKLPINVQIKDLGKCSDQDKKALVIFDQFKSFFGASDDFENMTVHVINGVDLGNVYDVKDHPDLTHNNVGIINIGVWENIEGIRKFGEIFSALRIAHDAGHTGTEAFSMVKEYIGETGQIFDKSDENMLKQLEDQWSDDPAKLMINIFDKFGSHFRDNSADMEGLSPRIKTNLSHKVKAERITPNPLPLKIQTRDPPTSLESLHSKLKERPLFQIFWNEGIGISDVIDRRYRNGPRGFIVDLTSDTFLPKECQTAYLVKNSNRWNIHGYDDKFLLERQFDDFINLCFRKTSVRRDFGNNNEFPNYIWNQIKINEPNKILLKPNLFRPSIYTLNESFQSNNKPSEKTKTFSPEVTVSPEILIDRVNQQLKTGSKCDKEPFKMLVGLNKDKTIPNIAFVKRSNGNLSLELLEPYLYNKLKRNLANFDTKLAFQRFWFECTDRIEVLTPKNKETPLGLILDLTSDNFLPNKHKKVYIVKNSERWNAFGYKDNLLSEGNFDAFVTTLFYKTRIRDFGHREYPSYIWGQIQKEWGINGRKGFELKKQKYRPNIYALKDIYSSETVDYSMIGVYTEYFNSLTGAVRGSLRKSGYRNLVQYFDHNRQVPKVLRLSKLPLQDFNAIIGN